MQVKAKLRYLRIAPRKVRLVVDMVRNKKVQEARQILNFEVKRASLPVLKLLNSAVANAHNNFQIEPENLYVSKITVDEGPKLKRWMPRARGTAYEIQKKTSHITLILDETEPSKKPAKKKTKPSGKKKTEKIEVKSPEKTDSNLAENNAETAPRARKQRPEERMEKPKNFKGIRRVFSRKAI